MKVLLHVKLLCCLMLSLSIFLSEPLLAGVSDAEWAVLKKKAADNIGKVIYDNDADDCFAFPKGPEPTIENFLEQRTVFLKDYPVDTIFYTVFCEFGYVPYRSNAGYTQKCKRPESDNTINLTPDFLRQGTDAMTIQVDYARKNNMAIFGMLRMNDVHDMYHRPGDLYPYFSPFKQKHPEMLFGKYYHQTPYGAWSSVDYGRKEVRDFFSGMVDEIAAKYEIDGLGFDFCRQPNLFSSVAHGEDISTAEINAMTEMFMRIRASAEKYGRDRSRPILIAVRVPDSVEYCRAIGIDLEKWLQDKLVDIVIVGGNFRMNTWEKMVALCHKYGVKCYASIDYPQFVEVNPKLSRWLPAAFYARIAAPLSAGVDGNFYFNLFNSYAVKKFMKPDLKDFRTLDKCYFITERFLTELPDTHLRNGERFNNLPRLLPNNPVPLQPGEYRNFILEFADDLPALKKDSIEPRVTGVIMGKIPEPDKLDVTSNGKKWIYQKTVNGLYYYSIPDGALKVGVNDLKIGIAKTGNGKIRMQTIMKGDKLLTGEIQAPWRRLFPCDENAENEKIIGNAYEITDLGKGYTNLLYPFSQHIGPEGMTVNFDCQVMKSSDEMGVVLRVADGKYVEIISLQPHQIKMINGECNVAFDTTGKFHAYQLKMTDTSAILSADGKVILESPLTVKVGTVKGDLKGFNLVIPGMNNASLLLGSLSDTGTGSARWRNVQISQMTGAVSLSDLAVTVDFPKNFKPQDVQTWTYSNEKKPRLLAGKNPYSEKPMVAEVELAAIAGEVEVIVSNGGVMTSVLVSKDQIIFPDGKVYCPKTMLGTVMRFELDGTGSCRVFFNGASPEEITMMLFVSNFLADTKAATMNGEESNIIRNGGIVVHHGSGKAQVKALRATIFEKK